MKPKDNHPIEMPVDLFEREYADEITWQTEALLGDAKDGSEDGVYSESEYDQAYEQAILLVAEGEGIDLI
jgi:hypothetical protein